MEKIICECCGREIDTEYEELEERTMWNGKKCMCCEECCEIVDEEKREKTEEDDYVDQYHEMKMLGLI